MRIREKINNIYLSAEVKGSGRPILCLSGFGCDHYNFELLELEGQMIMLDNRGLGASENDLDAYTISQLAQDAHAFMLKLGHSKYDVIGISMGGFIAQEVTFQFPNNVKSLSLLCTTSGGDSFLPIPKLGHEELVRFYELEPEVAARLAITSTVYDKSLIEKIVKIRLEHPANIKEVLKQKYAVDDFLIDSKPLYLIKCPTMIMTGENDRFVPPKNSITLQEKIPNSKLEVIGESDHLFFLERPELVSDKLNLFLQEEKTI